VNKFEQAGLVQANLFLFGLRHTKSAKGRVACTLEACPLQTYCVKDVRFDTSAKKPWRSRARVTHAALHELEIRKLQLFELYPQSEASATQIAREITHELQSKGFKAGGQKTLSALATWLACRKLGMPVLANEVAGCYGLSTSALYHAYTKANLSTGMTAEPLSASSLVDRAIKFCQLDVRLKGSAERMIGILKTDGRNPSSVAAAAVFLSSEELGYKVTQCQVSDALMITEVTVRNVIRRIKRKRRSTQYPLQRFHDKK